jgi:serine protease Do
MPKQMDTSKNPFYTAVIARSGATKQSTNRLSPRIYGSPRSLWSLAMTAFRSVQMFIALFCLLFIKDLGAVPEEPAKPVPQTKEQMQITFAPVVTKSSPAVVNIYAVRVLQQRGYSILLEDPIFRHFFGDHLRPKGETGPKHVQSSLGSGVIVRADGIVITNFHVIQHAEEIKVVLLDGREFDADIVVKDPRTDLVALKLKTDEKNLPFLELRDADELNVGDVVLAIGNPFGFGNTVTMGIVSALARTQMGVKDFRSFIQTDASINPGNSGGPLISLDGKLVGINTAIFSQTGSSIGLGFAIPSNLVAPVIASVDHGGQVKRPWLGVEVQSISPKMMQELHLKKVAGVVIKRVYENSPAARAGLNVGDIILDVNDKEVINESGYRFRIATAKVGQESILTIQRGEEIKKVPVMMEVAPEIPGNQRIELTGRHPLVGASVTGLSPAVADELGIPYEGPGVVIFAITAGSPASISGLLPGDVIVKVNDKEIKTVDDLLRNIGRSRQGWKIDFRRDSEIQQLYIQSW